MGNVADAPTPEDRRSEFAALRQEIAGRSAHQHMLLSLNLTVVATLAGFVLSDHADQKLLLLLPIVSGSVALLWYDHARNIESLGDYVREELPGFDGYERRIARLERSEWRRVPMTVALLILLVGTPIAGVVIPFEQVSGALWILWALGVAISAASAGFLLHWLAQGFTG